MSHIVIDARRINSSTGHYIERLVDNLQSIDKENSYTVIVLEKEMGFWRPTSKNFRVITTRADHYTFAEQLSFAWLLYRLKPDFVHFSMPQQPLLWFGKRVTTIHDTTLIRYENLDQNVVIYRIRKLIFTLLMRNVIARSRFIISPTDFVKNDLDAWTGRKYSAKFKRTYLSGDMIHANSERIDKLDGKKFIVYVGNAFPYKNVGRVVEAFAALKGNHPDLHLALAGKKEFFYEQIEQKTQKMGVRDAHILGYISDGEKRWLYQNAEAFVTASLSEGFCIPLLEAMYERCPVIASNISCLPEVAGDAAEYFDPLSVNEMAAAIERVISDEARRKELIELGYKQAAKYSWEQMAQQTYEIYRDIL